MTPAEAADARTALAAAKSDVAPLNPYTVTVARGVTAHAAHVDDLIASHLQGWTLERLPAVDRAILRVAVWELLHADDVPGPVAVDEAVELAKELSTDDSPGFVNGVLGQVMLVTPQIRAAAQAVRASGRREARGGFMTRLELRALIAAILAATVILGAVMCAAYGQAAIAAALAIYALGVGAWLYHSIERLVLARRIETVRTAVTPFRPLLPVMAAIMALTQAVVRSLSDVTEVAPRRWIPITRGRKATTTSRSEPGLAAGVGRAIAVRVSESLVRQLWQSRWR